MLVGVNVVICARFTHNCSNIMHEVDRLLSYVYTCTY